MIHEFAFAVVFVSVIFGALTQGSTGVGMGLVAAPVMAIVNPDLVPGPILILAAMLSLFVFIRDRVSVDWRAFGLLLAGRVPAAVAAGLTASLLPQRWFLIIFSCLILAALAISIWGPKVRRTPASTLTAGAASGFMGTITGIGAPPIAIVFQNAAGPLMRGTLGLYFFVGAGVSVASLWAFAGNARSDIELSIKLLPAVLIGYLLSYPARRFVDAGLLRPIVLGTCGVSAVILIARAIAA